MPEVSINVVQLLSSLVLVIIWFARLEFFTTQNKIDIQILKDQDKAQAKAHTDLEKQIMNDLADIKIGIAKIEERLYINRGDD